MNKKSKEYLEKLNDMLFSSLKEAVPGVNIYQDSVSEDEEDLKKIHHFIFETGGFTKPETIGSLSQDVTVYYFSEGRDDLDSVALDIISKMEDNKHVFVRSTKEGYPKGEADNYVDQLTFTFSRKVKYGC